MVEKVTKRERGCSQSDGPGTLQTSGPIRCAITSSAACSMLGRLIRSDMVKEIRG